MFDDNGIFVITIPGFPRPYRHMGRAGKALRIVSPLGAEVPDLPRRKPSAASASASASAREAAMPKRQLLVRSRQTNEVWTMDFVIDESDGPQGQAVDGGGDCIKESV